MEKQLSSFPGARDTIHRTAAALILTAACLAFCGGGCTVVKPPESRLECMFYPSAALVSLPDGGSMLIDIGQGITPEVMRHTRQNLVGADIVYKAFALMHWRPRIDWVIIVPDQGVWDYRFIDIINSFDIGGIYFPYNLRAGTVEPKMTRMLLQVALSGCAVYDLTKEEINLYQSPAGVRVRQFLPARQQSAERSADEKAALCLRLDYGKTSILITSRLSARQEEELLAVAGDALKADVVFHPAASAPAFLAAVNPSWDIVSSTAITKISTNGERVRVEADRHE